MRVLAFDAGICHVGLVAAEVGEGWDEVEVTHAACIDLTDVQHRRVPAEACRLPHTNCLAHRYAHFVQEYAPAFAEADELWVEQQPPGSAGMVFEQLLHFQFAGRTTAVAPRTVHAHFGLPGGDYERRKRASCRVALRLFPRLEALARGAARFHDIADAACILRCVCDRRAEALRKRRRAQAHCRATELWAFAYRPAACAACARPGSGEQTAYDRRDCPRCASAGMRVD